MKKLLSIILMSFFALISISFPYDKFLSYTNGMFVTQNELNEMRKGNFILSSDIASVSANDDENFDYENQYDPYDYPARITVDSRDYCYTQHFDGHARIFDMGGDD